MTTVSSTSSATTTATGTTTPSPTATADKAVKLLMAGNDVVQSLSTQSTRWTPPTSAQVFSTLWALFNVNSTKIITQSDVQSGVNAEGGTIAEANALWKQLDPNNNGAVSATQFVNSPYLAAQVQANLSAVQTTVAKVQLDNPGTSNTVLDAFSSGGADILSGAAHGYNGNAVGTGNNFNYFNLFV
ncbi:MAG: hypothetical protein KGL10_03330 [Alphaproteobacteria bacterium]|nr:hypothetical protein [Alphaproteobacteria bacterium]MDE2336322.1 hypothetical protein [Alphaproteobacteria bacterium]